jgi:LacI family transcriptional regulator
LAVRLKDIARDLNVSTVTVSKVLRGNSDISEKTRARVLQRMAELKYQPNMLARGLASGKTYTVGLVVPDLVHPFFAEFAKSLSAVLRASQRALLIASSEENPEIEQQEIRTLLSRGVDVLLIASCQPKFKSFYEPGEERTPFLLIDRNFPNLAAHFVGSDDYKAGCLATQHLIDIGKLRIAHIGGRDMSPSLERMRGYRDTLANNGLPVDEEIIVTLERFEETGDSQGHDAMQRLLALDPRPDSVFCYNDLTAIGAMAATREAGLRIPQDIAFVGCGNMRYATYLKTPLSSIDHDTDRLGARAGELALRLAEDADLETCSILLEPRLIQRESTILP